MAIVVTAVILEAVATHLFVVARVHITAPDIHTQFSRAVFVAWLACGLSIVAGVLTVVLTVRNVRRVGGFGVVAACCCVLAPLTAAAVISAVNLVTDDYLVSLMERFG
jgi:hypothetical protein